MSHLFFAIYQPAVLHAKPLRPTSITTAPIKITHRKGQSDSNIDEDHSEKANQTKIKMKKGQSDSNIVHSLRDV